MYCEQCGTKISENKRFCTKCEEEKTIIIEIPKSDIASINDISLRAILVKNILINIILIVLFSIVSSIYYNLLITVIIRPLKLPPFMFSVSLILSFIASFFTIKLIYKKYNLIKQKKKKE